MSLIASVTKRKLVTPTRGDMIYRKWRKSAVFWYRAGWSLYPSSVHTGRPVRPICRSLHRVRESQVNDGPGRRLTRSVPHQRYPCRDRRTPAGRPVQQLQPAFRNGQRRRGRSPLRDVAGAPSVSRPPPKRAAPDQRTPRGWRSLDNPGTMAAFVAAGRSDDERPLWTPPPRLYTVQT